MSLSCCKLLLAILLVGIPFVLVQFCATKQKVVDDFNVPCYIRVCCGVWIVLDTVIWKWWCIMNCFLLWFQRRLPENAGTKSSGVIFLPFHSYWEWGPKKVYVWVQIIINKSLLAIEYLTFLCHFESHDFCEAGSSFKGASLPRSSPKQKKTVRITGKVTAAVTTATTPYEEIEEYESHFNF